MVKEQTDPEEFRERIQVEQGAWLYKNGCIFNWWMLHHLLL